jgi:hypothetical protein
MGQPRRVDTAESLQMTALAGPGLRFNRCISGKEFPHQLLQLRAPAP